MRKTFTFLFLVGLTACLLDFGSLFATNPSTEGGIRNWQTYTDSVEIHNAVTDTSSTYTVGYYETVCLAWYVANIDGLADSVGIEILIQGSLDGTNWYLFDSLAVNTDGIIRKGDTASWGYELGITNDEKFLYHRLLVSDAADSCDKGDSLYVKTRLWYAE